MKTKFHKFKNVEEKDISEPGKIVRCQSCGNLGYVSFKDFEAHKGQWFCENCTDPEEVE